ncbi:hypothetical protein V6N13_143902 [Hibiscus sabdariffa]
MTPGTNEATDSRQGKRTKEAKVIASKNVKRENEDLNKNVLARRKSRRPPDKIRMAVVMFVPALESQGNATEGEMRDDKHVAYAAHDQTP